MAIDLYDQVGSQLNAMIKHLNFQVAPAYPKGKPAKNVQNVREYRLQLINKQNDTSKSLVTFLSSELRKMNEIRNVKFNQISPNSSKFSSYSFELSGKEFDIILAKGSNKGENFEVKTVSDLGKYFKSKNDSEFSKLIHQMNEANPEFASVEIVKVEQRKGSTKKEGVPIENLGAVIGDIVLKDASNHNWFISLKDINGDTFSSYSGAASIFDSNGNLQPKSVGADFLRSFGVDLNKVQEGFDVRANKKIIRPKYDSKLPNQNEIKKIFERAWGMNYFYVRRQSNGWKVFWLDRTKLNKLTSNIKIDKIKYPDKSSKQISIFCTTNEGEVLIEIRNSKAGEYPNDIKFKVRK